MPTTAALCLCVLLMTSLVCAEHVIIVGAGVAGLAAARYLLDSDGDYNVTVLEARDRYGGRVWTNRTALDGATGVEVDLGASFLDISDHDDNPLAQLVDDFNLDVFESDGGSEMVYGHGAGEGQSVLLDQSTLDEAWEANQKIVKKVADGKWESIASVLDAIKSDDDLYASYLTPAGRYYCSVTIELLYGVTVSEITAKLFGEHEYDFDLDHYFLTQGFGQVTDKLVSGHSGDTPVTVTLGQTVNSVVYNSEYEVVTVSTTEGQIYRGDKVLLAVPLGVMKDDDIDFSPSLSGKKSRAFVRVGLGAIGVLNKVILQFDKVFWPSDTEFFGIPPHPDPTSSWYVQPGIINYWINMYPIVQKPILMGHALGVNFELKNDYQIEELALEELKFMFGASAVESSTLVKIVRTKWLDDQYSKGSTVSFGHTVSKDSYETIAESVCPYLYFAGDYTSIKHLGTVRGAYESGIRAAKEIDGECSGASTVLYNMIVLVATLVLMGEW